MADLHVVAIITGRPGTGDELEPALTQLAAATRSHQGCLLYALQRGTEDRDVFVTVEKWSSADDLQAHLAHPDVAQALSGPSGALLAEAPRIISTLLLPADDELPSSY